MYTSPGLVCQPPSDHNVAVTTWYHLVALYTRYLVEQCTAINNMDIIGMISSNLGLFGAILLIKSKTPCPLNHVAFYNRQVLHFG